MIAITIVFSIFAAVLLKFGGIHLTTAGTVGTAEYSSFAFSHDFSICHAEARGIFTSFNRGGRSEGAADAARFHELEELFEFSCALCLPKRSFTD